MRRLPLSTIAGWTGGTLLGDDVTVDAIATDTRALQAGDAGAGPLFVALRGERFDGHDHVAVAAAAGARAAMVSRALDTALPQVLVADTQAALGAIATAMQRTRATRVVAITGSNGKTSVKQLLLAILQRGAGAYANPGNRNNEIGLPLAVIDAPDDAALAVYEMGAGKPGDIAYLAAIARPDVALVNNVAAAHLERLGSLDGVADTKAAIYDALADAGVAVVNADDAYSAQFVARVSMLPGAARRVLRFSLDATTAADVTARDIAPREGGSDFTLATALGEARVALPLPGRHSVANALAAAALAIACGRPLADIVAGLQGATPVGGRLVRHALRDGATLVDDSYNANPGSLAAAITLLAALPGPRWLVLGDMRELGADGATLHAAAGRAARDAGIDRLYALGELSAQAASAFGDRSRTFKSHAVLAEALRADLVPGAQVLVKGSRGSAMDRIVDALLQGNAGDAA